MPPSPVNLSFRSNPIHFRVTEKWHIHFSNPSFKKSGFSLVEVALALGIMGFAMVSIIGLVSVGLDHSRQNLDRSVEAQILDAARAHAKAAYEQGALASLSNGAPLYFSHDGLPLKPAASDAERLFSATLAPQEKTLPGSEQKLWGVSITIRAYGRNNQLFGSHVILFAK